MSDKKPNYDQKIKSETDLGEDFDIVLEGLVYKRKGNVETLMSKNIGVDPRAVVNRLLYWCRVLDVKGLTHLKLQKLLYYSYGIHIWNSSSIIFNPMCTNNNLNIDFWGLGPVITKVYHELKHYGNAVVAENFEEYEKALLKEVKNESEEDPQFTAYEIEVSNRKTIDNAIKYVLVAIGDKSASELVKLTHHKRSAWFKFYTNKYQSKNLASDILNAIIDELEYYGYFKKEYDVNKVYYVRD